MQIDGFTIDDVAIQPSKFRPTEIIALMPADRLDPANPGAVARGSWRSLPVSWKDLRIGKAELGKLVMENTARADDAHRRQIPIRANSRWKASTDRPAGAVQDRSLRAQIVQDGEPAPLDDEPGQFRTGALA